MPRVRTTLPPIIAPNKIYYSDCLAFVKRLRSNSIDLILTDPPYRVTKEKWDRNDPVTPELIAELSRVAKESCSIYFWCGIGEKSQSLIRWFPILSNQFIFKDLITWKKRRGIGMRKGWLYTREECMWFVKNNKQFIWNKDAQYNEEKNEWFELGGMSSLAKNGKPRAACKSEFKRHSNVWIDIPEKLHHKDKSVKFHFTPKPEELMERIILVHTKPGDLILDPFMGSGTTCLVAKRLGRNYVACDNEKEFCVKATERVASI